MSETKITYQDVLDFPGYRVGNDGSVWTSWQKHAIQGSGRPGSQWLRGVTWKPLRPDRNPKGYLRVTLCRDNKTYKRWVHRLVLEAFVGSCPPGMTCRHFPDRDPANCRVENLSWSTQKENLADRIVHGTSPRGERNGNAKLTADDVRSIRLALKSKESQYRIAARYGVDHKAISNIKFRKSWSHVV